MSLTINGLTRKQLYLNRQLGCPYFSPIGWDLEYNKNYKMSWSIKVKLYKEKEEYGPYEEIDTDIEYSGRQNYWNINPIKETDNTYQLDYNCIYRE